jgi:hypothetical protein
LLLDNARVHDNFVAHGVNGVLNLGRGQIEGETASMLVLKRALIGPAAKGWNCRTGSPAPPA